MLKNVYHVTISFCLIKAVSFPKMDKKKRVFTVLAIDGGGVRGVIPARILEEIEKRTGKPIAESFDLITGISTGAILAASLTMPDKNDPTKPRVTAETLKKIYVQECPKIFPEKGLYARTKSAFGGVLYDSKVLDDHFANTYGEAKLGDSLTSLIIPVVDIKNWRSVWLSNIKGKEDTSPEQWSTMYTKDAIRSAVAAPTYFGTKWVETTPNPDLPPQRHALIDGGFLSGNMMTNAYAIAERLAPPDAEIVVVHLGTGSMRREISPDEWNAKGSLKIATDGTLMSLITSIPGDSSVQFMKDLLGDNMISIDSHIDPHRDPNAPSTNMVDALKGNMDKLEKWADKLVEDNDAVISNICDIITTRSIASRDFETSQKAYEELSTMLLNKNTVPGLIRFYDTVMQYVEEPTRTAPSDERDVKENALQLVKHHVDDLRDLYHLVLDKKNHDHTLTGLFNSIVSTAQEGIENTQEKFKNAFNKLFGLSDNDNKKDSDQKPAQKNEKPRRRWGWGR